MIDQFFFRPLNIDVNVLFKKTEREHTIEDSGQPVHCIGNHEHSVSWWSATIHSKKCHWMQGTHFIYLTLMLLKRSFYTPE